MSETPMLILSAATVSAAVGPRLFDLIAIIGPREELSGKARLPELYAEL